MSLQESDVEAAAVAKTPNRVSLADIEASITQEHSFNAGTLLALCQPEGAPAVHPSLHVLTLHLLVMDNGFSVVGASAPADAENFDQELGEKLAREDAIRKAWPLMGFALRDRLYRDSFDALVDLLDDQPLEHMRRVLEFAELPESPQLERHLRAASIRSTSNRWRDDLSPAQQTILDDLLRPDLQRYGYGDSARPERVPQIVGL